MVDLLWKKCLELTNFDIKRALYLALIVSDLRTRGPCGAYYAIRGKSLLPPSIFDGELPSILQSNRLDAFQHFFGYAFIQNLEGGLIASSTSNISKNYQYWFPRLSNGTKIFHLRRDIDTGSPGGIKEALNIEFTSPYWEKTRTLNDIEIDKFYNRLGIEFGKRLETNPATLPSTVIGDPYYDLIKINMGLGGSADRNWIALDPNMEVPKVVWKPPEERLSKSPFHLKFPTWSPYEFCKGEPTGKDCLDSVKAAAFNCANAPSGRESSINCDWYQEGMLIIMDDIKKKNMTRLKYLNKF